MTTAYDPADVQVSPHPWVGDQARRYEESGGADGADINGSPCLLLDYLGRRSGVWRRTVLIYGRDGEDYLIVASKNGADTHPHWFLSLQEHPEVHVRVLGERFAVRAEVLGAEDKARVWPHLLTVYAPFEEYQQKTQREIPVLRLVRTS